MRPVSNRAPKPFLTISEVSDFLQVSDRTVRRWIDAGALPAHAIGRGWRISRRDVDNFMRERRQGGCSRAR